MAMNMKQCPDCGEKYSDTYRRCPFCEEERTGGRPRRSRGGKRSAGRSAGQLNLLTPLLVILILIMAALLAFLLFGKNFKERAEKLPEDKPAVEAVKPDEGGESAQKPEETPGQPDVSMPEDSVGTEDPVVEQPVEELPAESDYDKANKLPKGLTLSTEDFTLKSLGETHTIRVSGGSGRYTWISEDDGIASVGADGTVTAVSGGTVNVLVTDGSKKAVCIVRVSGTGAAVSGSSGGSTSGLKAGAAIVVNGGNGVRVRSGPGTSYEILATVPNGADIQVVESAGDGWYQIKFSDVGGATKTGYMKGEYLSNR